LKDIKGGALFNRESVVKKHGSPKKLKNRKTNILHCKIKPQKPEAEDKKKSLAKKLELLEYLDQEDQQTIINVIDSLLT
jgi:chaperonin GroEL (HSP60 family)